MNLACCICSFVISLLMHFQDELSDVVDVKDPDKTPVCERRKERLAAEAAKFDSDHYL